MERKETQKIVLVGLVQVRTRAVSNALLVVHKVKFHVAIPMSVIVEYDFKYRLYTMKNITFFECDFVWYYFSLH